jgi:hypothetical protein
LHDALGVIRDADLSRTQDIVVFFFFVLSAEPLALAPIAVYAVAPAQSAAVLQRTGNWLEWHNRKIDIVVSVIFGAYFVWTSLDLQRAGTPASADTVGATDGWPAMPDAECHFQTMRLLLSTH